MELIVFDVPLHCARFVHCIAKPKVPKSGAPLGPLNVPETPVKPLAGNFVAFVPVKVMPVMVMASASLNAKYAPSIAPVDAKNVMFGPDTVTPTLFPFWVRSTVANGVTPQPDSIW